MGGKKLFLSLLGTDCLQLKVSYMPKRHHSGVGYCAPLTLCCEAAICQSRNFPALKRKLSKGGYGPGRLSEASKKGSVIVRYTA